jgi:hypothetical protein
MPNDNALLPPTIHLGYLPDEMVIAHLCRAEESIRFVGPGLPEPVARELSRRWKELGPHAVEVLIDADAELCRIGYCDGASLKLLVSTASELGTSIHRQMGIRLCVLEIDGERIIYAPTPRLVEESDEVAAQVQLSPSQGGSLAEQILSHSRLAPHPITNADVKKVDQDLAISPPQPFDLARQVHVLSTKFQFVEFSLTGAALARKRVPVPQDLLGLANDQATKELLHTSFQLIMKGDEVSGERLLQWRNEIEKRFLKTIPGYGTVILNTDRDAFSKAVKKLREEVEKFQKEAEAKLDKAIRKNCAQVTTRLLPNIMKSPPERWNLFLGDKPVEQDFRHLLEGDLKRAYGEASNHLGKIEVRDVYKNITVEMLHDQCFAKAAEKAGLQLKGKVEEYDAARARR